jgi:hypothetical protein
MTILKGIVESEPGIELGKAIDLMEGNHHWSCKASARSGIIQGIKFKWFQGIKHEVINNKIHLYIDT